MTDEIKQLGVEWYLADSSTGRITDGPFASRTDAEIELMWQQRQYETGDIEYDMRKETDHAETDDHWDYYNTSIYED